MQENLQVEHLDQILRFQFDHVEDSLQTGQIIFRFSCTVVSLDVSADKRFDEVAQLKCEWEVWSDRVKCHDKRGSFKFELIELWIQKEKDKRTIGEGENKPGKAKQENKRERK